MQRIAIPFALIIGLTTACTPKGEDDDGGDDTTSETGSGESDTGDESTTAATSSTGDTGEDTETGAEETETGAEETETGVEEETGEEETGTSTPDEDFVAACAAFCETLVACDEDQEFASVEECSEACVTEGWAEIQDAGEECIDLNNAFMNCVGALDCEGYTAWLEEIPEVGYPCEDEELATEVCADGKDTPSNPGSP